MRVRVRRWHVLIQRFQTCDQQDPCEEYQLWTCPPTHSLKDQTYVILYQFLEVGMCFNAIKRVFYKKLAGSSKSISAHKKKRGRGGKAQIRAIWMACSVTQFFVSITHNSKMVGPIARSPFGCTITLFPSLNYLIFEL